MRTTTVSIAVLAFGALAFSLPNRPQSLDGLSDAELKARLDEAAQRMPASQLTDDMLRGLTMDRRMDTDANGNVQISKRFFHSEETTPAPHGWGWEAPHQGWGAPSGGHPGQQLVGPFAFQLGAYYNPYLPAPMSYGSAAPQPSYTQAPAYSSTPAPYTTTTAYTTTAAPYSPPASYGMGGYTASASLPQGYGSSSSGGYSSGY